MYTAIDTNKVQRTEERTFLAHYATLKLALPATHDARLALANPFNSTANHLIDDLLGGLPLIHDSRSLAHQEWPCVVHSVIINIVSHPLEVVLDRDDTLIGQLLDVVLAVVLPVFDVRVAAHSERTASENDGADIVVEARCADGFLVGLRCAGLL